MEENKTTSLSQANTGGFLFDLNLNIKKKTLKKLQKKTYKNTLMTLGHRGFLKENTRKLKP